MDVPYIRAGRLSERLSHVGNAANNLRDAALGYTRRKRILLPLEPKVPNKFILPGLSRMELRSSGSEAAVPRFDAAGFEKNLEDICNTVGNYRDLTDRIADAIGTFIWKPDWTTLVVHDPKTGAPILVPGKKFPSFDRQDIEVAHPRSINDFAIWNRRLVYVPDSRFDLRGYFYYFPVPVGLEAKEPVITDVNEQNIHDFAYIRAMENAKDNRLPVPASVIVSPILWMPEHKVMGYFTAGYTEEFVFGGTEGHLPRPGLERHMLRYFYLLSEAASLKLTEFEISRKDELRMLEMSKLGEIPQ